MQYINHIGYCGRDDSSNHLIHHGIKGQKWGVKNGPPYPLGSQPKSKVKKNADTTPVENPRKELLNMGFKVTEYGSGELKKDFKDEYGQNRHYTFYCWTINEKSKMDNKHLQYIKEIVKNPSKIEKEVRHSIVNNKDFIDNIWNEDVASMPYKEKQEYVKRNLGRNPWGKEFYISIDISKLFRNYSTYDPSTWPNIIGFSFDDADLFYGHTVQQDYNIKNKKPYLDPDVTG